VSARNLGALEEIQRSSSSQDKVLVIPIDLGSKNDFREEVGLVVQHYGRIDLLVNNGGISQRSEAMETDESIERHIMEVDYFGQVALSKAVLSQMQQQKSGHLIIISSLTGKFGFYLRSSYAAAKHALHGYFESLRLEQESRGIKVTMVCPALIKTNISRSAMLGDGSQSGKMDEMQETGMSAEECAQEILRAAKLEKREVIIGAKGKWAVLVYRLFPNFFYKRLRKHRPQ
jgi:short-subunit dehydrogenase